MTAAGALPHKEPVRGTMVLPPVPPVPPGGFTAADKLIQHRACLGE
jgi:hypothetical protein